MAAHRPASSTDLEDLNWLLCLLSQSIKPIICCYEIIVFVGVPECVVTASVYGLPHVGFFIFFFLLIFSENFEPTGLKFDQNAWIGPE